MCIRDRRSSTSLLDGVWSEIARAVNEFELSQEWIRYEQSKGPDIRHHEQNESKKKAFVDQGRALIDTFEKMGNPILKK